MWLSREAAHDVGQQSCYLARWNSAESGSKVAWPVPGIQILATPPSASLIPTDRHTEGGEVGEELEEKRPTAGRETHRRPDDPPRRRVQTAPFHRRNKEIASPSNVDKQQGSARLRASRKRRLGGRGVGAGGAPQKGCQGRKLSEVTNYAHRQDFFFFLSEFSYLKISMASTQQ